MSAPLPEWAVKRARELVPLQAERNRDAEVEGVREGVARELVAERQRGRLSMFREKLSNPRYAFLLWHYPDGRPATMADILAGFDAGDPDCIQIGEEALAAAVTLVAVGWNKLEVTRREGIVTGLESAAKACKSMAETWRAAATQRREAGDVDGSTRMNARAFGHEQSEAAIRTLMEAL